MSPKPRFLLPLLGAGLCALIAIVAWRLFGGNESILVQPDISPARVEPEATTPLALAQDVPGQISAVAAATNLNLTVMGEDGRKVPEARIILTDPSGEVFESQGDASLRNVLSGEWLVNVRCKGQLNHRETIEVREGKSERMVIRLARVIRIHGTAVNVFGEPFGSIPIWLLPEGESHPSQRIGVLKTPGTMITVAGEFQVDVPRAGKYKVSLGPIGKEVLVAEELVHLHAGGPTELSIVIPGGTDLQVVVDPVPLKVAEGNVQLRAVLLVRERDLRSGRKKRKRPALHARPSIAVGEKHLRPRGKQEDGDSKAARRKSASPPTPPVLLGGEGAVVIAKDKPPGPREIGPGTPQASKPVWKEYRTAPIEKDGTCSFGVLPTDLEMRLAILRPLDRYESSQTFTLQADTRTVVRVQVPDKRAPHLRRETPIADLSAYIQVQSATRSDHKPGFTWN